ATVSSVFQGAKTDNDTKSNIFSGKTFGQVFIMPLFAPMVGPFDLDVRGTLKKFLFMAAKINVEIFHSHSSPALTLYKAPDIKAIVRDGKQNIIYPQWVLDSVNKKQVLSFRS
ncbi:12294_t:CDS:2, partial [Acaulospora colombiana]